MQLSGHRKGTYLTILILTLWLVSKTQAVIEEVEVDPSNTNGFELGEISFVQFVLGSVIFLKIVALYAGGVLPIEIDLGYKFGGDYNDDFNENDAENDNERDYESDYGRRRVFRRPRKLMPTLSKEGGSTYLVDCPMQYLCEVDTWAQKDHQHNFLENLLARWFRSDKPWIREEAGIYGGASSCREMYPCPFDIQDVVGIRIPGSSNATTGDMDLIGPYSV